ncbi:hypothetical protein DFH07DRAFT_769654 [Mycena maculata]|uniref:Uncharacterized protein n=1 Tax=Mycena maculata TaxID=230809 RepID=A0AAD7JKT0_9AGAR|nr:hypothetical protein DFH07DRAFT_769654 [Mycena maculata]
MSRGAGNDSSLELWLSSEFERVRITKGKPVFIEFDHLIEQMSKVVADIPDIDALGFGLKLEKADSFGVVTGMVLRVVIIWTHLEGSRGAWEEWGIRRSLRLSALTLAEMGWDGQGTTTMGNQRVVFEVDGVDMTLGQKKTTEFSDEEPDGPARAPGSDLAGETARDQKGDDDTV